MSIYAQINNLGLKFTDGTENQSGIQEKAWFIPLSWLKTIANPKIGATAGSILEITESHVMETGKKPVQMAPLYKKSGLKSTMEGEELSKMFKMCAEFFIPQISADNLGTIGAIKNYHGIVLLKRPGVDTEFIQVGSEGLAANVTGAEVDLGTGPTGSVGIKVTFEAYGSMPFYVYKGELPSDKVPSSASKSS